MNSLADLAPLIGSLEEGSTTERVVECLSTFLQGHLSVVVDYADRYGVNIPLNEEDAVPVEDANGTHPDDHDSLAALLQTATSHLAQDPGDSGHGPDMLDHAGFEADGDDVLKKLIEDSILSQFHEAKEPMVDEHASADPPDVDSKDLASFISETLKNDPTIPSNGLPNLSTAAAALTIPGSTSCERP